MENRLGPKLDSTSEAGPPLVLDGARATITPPTATNSRAAATIDSSNVWHRSCGDGGTPGPQPIFQINAAAPLTLGTSQPSASTITLDTISVVNTASAAQGESLYGILASE